MVDKRKAMVLASFVGDSLALGAHWIYDVFEIIHPAGLMDREGRVDGMDRFQILCSNSHGISFGCFPDGRSMATPALGRCPAGGVMI